ncbi:MAG: heparinase II/III family protein, partial [Oscillospiraceae bacterium]|nr:heparinase II/III family protein [Oscillospiraceae bacterium]
WKNGILLENYRAVRKADIYGNFGMHQLALAKSAVVLASEPESEEILDFTFKTGGYVGYKKFEVSGGNINSYFVDELDRDGLGYESSPQYNYVAVDRIVEVADALSKYTGKNKEKYNIVNRPKFLQMISAYSSLVLSDSHTAQIGDSQGTATLNFVDSVSNTLIAFKLINGSEYAKYLAEQIYIRSGGDVADLHYDIFTKNPESAKKDVEDFASGPSKPQSELLAGFGFAALRAGEKHKGVSADGNNNTLRSFWIYSGWGKSSHHQLDSLNIGIEAFGLNLSPDLGYPETTGEDANRMQWVNTTLSHNTVVVDEKQQERTVLRSATPLHYDNTERVKLIDMRCEDAYPDIDEYRRTLVMIEAPGDISYGVDFFNVQGGNTHQFSFHAQSTEISETEGLELVPQVDGENNYVGSYAGAEVPGFTPDPDTANTANDVLRYPRGYTWIKNLDRAQNPKNSFAVDFKIKDFRKAISDNREIHLRMTQVNDFSASEVAIGDGYVPAKAVNKELPREIKYAIVRRDGENLKSLFTTVYEPYKDNRYIVSITPVELVPAPADASAKAVCVE